MQSSGTSPQFNTAEFSGERAPDWCRACKKAITTSYYRLGTNMVCPECAARAKASVRTLSHSSFLRALMFGSLAAVAGLVVYAAFEIMTGWMIGYVALAVGWMVGTAMMKGSAGVGTRKLQIAAVILTYFAVSFAAIPVGFAQFSKSRPHAASSSAGSTSSASTADASQTNTSAGQQPSSRFNSAVIAKLLLYLAGIGLASPFIELTSGVSGVIGIAILFIGMQIAWKLTAGRSVVIDGPFANS